MMKTQGQAGSSWALVPIGQTQEPPSVCSGMIRARKNAALPWETPNRCLDSKPLKARLAWEWQPGLPRMEPRWFGRRSCRHWNLNEN